jgi:hypothetical protein
MSGGSLASPPALSLTCPQCQHEHTPPLRVVAETSRRATRRPVTPEIIHPCPKCGTLLVLSLHPAPLEAIAS